MIIRPIAVALMAASSVALLAASSSDIRTPVQLRLDASALGELQWRSLGPVDGDMVSATPDSSFPYRVCGVERARGAVCVSSLGTDARMAGLGVIALRGRTVRPDPSDSDVLFGGNLVRYDRRLEQVVPVAPPAEATENAAAPPPVIVFGPDGKTLYYGARSLWRTTTSGQHWTAASPDLTGGGPADTISALAFSPVSARLVWAGTSAGVLQVSQDAGATWTRRTSAADAGQASAVLAIEGSHFDFNSTYIVLDRADVSLPSVFRTRDGGETWKALPIALTSGRVYVIREDLFRRGLLFAGTDAGPLISYDDGESWSPLALNLPRAPVRDLFVRDSDLVVATAGQGVWMLPDISVLRQATPDVLSAAVFLFRPAAAWRLRARERPEGNGVGVEPEGAAFHYSVGPKPTAALTLEIIATVTGEVLRRFTSEAPAGSDDWLDNSPGLHRRIWDLRYTSPGTLAGQRPGEAVRLPGLRVLPNAYQVRLTAGSQPLRQAVNIRMDPRVRATATDLMAGFTLAKSIDGKLRQLFKERSGLGTGDGPRLATIDRALGQLGAVYLSLQQFDGRPTPAIETAAAAAIDRAERALTGGE